ncbi:MAG: hypothetical protein IMZ62_10490 [Chloroflexi bacterium]|nr:hypothetical protein [Chloroflexota bacterium]MBE3117898.1 hypothetical protein [Candidatus Atribacteria bacterium]
MSESKQVKRIKDYIVKAHRAGACGKNGEHIPRARMGRVGKGSVYVCTMSADDRQRYGQEYRRIFGHD